MSDPLHPQDNRRLNGNVLLYLLTRSRGFVRNDRDVTADIAQWYDCRS